MKSERNRYVQFCCWFPADAANGDGIAQLFIASRPTRGRGAPDRPWRWGSLSL